MFKLFKQKTTYDTLLSAESEVNFHDKKPTKPGIPILLPCSLFMWGSAAFVLDKFAWSQLGENPNCIILPLLITAVLLALLWIKRIRKVIFIIASIILGVALGFSGCHNMINASNWSVENGSQDWTLTLLGDVEKSDYGAKVTASAKDESGRSCNLTIYFSDENELLCGQVIKTKGAAKSLKQNAKDFSKTNGVVASLNVKEYEIVEQNIFQEFIINARSKAIENFSKYSSSEAGVLQALVCGYKNTIKEDGTYDKFKICGLAHIVAVSGAHLAIVIGVLLSMLRALKVSRKLTTLLCVLSVLAYLVFSGIPISAVRSAIMVILSLTSSLFGRRSSPINALSLCIIFFIAHDPCSSLSISLFLSATSTLGIMLFASLFSSYFNIKNDRLNSLVAQPCSLTLASNISTLPFSSAVFSQISTISLFSNIIATPLFTLGCICGLMSAIVGCIFAFLSPFACYIARICCFPLNLSVSLMSRIPFSSIAIQSDVYPMLALTILISILLYLKWPSIKPKIFIVGACTMSLALMLVFIVLPKSSSNEVVMMDVGQGDAILIKSEGHAILIDTGNQKAKLKEELAKNSIYTLDAVILTHHDDDHIGCLTDLTSYENVNEVYSFVDATSCDCKNCGEMRSDVKNSIGKELKGLNVEDTIQVGEFSLVVLWPKTYQDEGGNGDSLCFKLTSDINKDGEDEFSMLLTGDAEKKQVKSIIKEKQIGNIDILKVGHHGSKISLDDENLSSLNPKFALISVGANNRYGHPKEETLQLLENHDVEILRTDENGEIKIKPGNDGYSISKEKG